jgi:hypothetical protein
MAKEMSSFVTSPYFCSIRDKHVLAEINPAPGTNEITVELQVDPGRTIAGTILDPDGEPIESGVEIQTLDVFQMHDSPRFSPEFSITGLSAGRTRVDFIHSGRKLAGAILLTGDEAGALTVRLQPWGAVVGRIVDGEGKPLNSVEIFSEVRDQPDPERGDLVDKPGVDGQGRFRIEGLVPGVKYDALGIIPKMALGPVLNGVQVAPGEVKDLGDIALPPWKKNCD